MKCDILSWGQQELNCNSTPEGSCADCGSAWNYMNMMGPGSFAHMLSSMETKRDGKVLETTLKFNDGDPKIYHCRIVEGRYFHLE